MEPDHLAQFASLLRAPDVLGQESKLFGDRPEDLAFRRDRPIRRNQLPRTFHVRPHGLLGEHMLAGLERGLDELRLQCDRQCDDDADDVRTGEHVDECLAWARILRIQFNRAVGSGKKLRG